MAGLSAEDLSAVLLSLKVATVATLAALPLAVLAAKALALRWPGRSLLDALVHLPLVLPPVATGFALLLLFGRQGPIGQTLAALGVTLVFRWTGAALAAAVMAFPLMVRPIRLAMEAQDREAHEAARTLGAGPVRRFVLVTLPLAAPGVAAGAVLGFAKALGEFGATITFVGAIPGETLTLPSAIYSATQSPGLERRALALCLVAASLAVVAVLIADAVGRAAVRWATRDGEPATASPKTLQHCPCCHRPTLSGRRLYEICPVCGWEDDGQDDPHAHEVWGGANGDLSLAEARLNFLRSGTSQR